jgi:hypothetical protein
VCACVCFIDGDSSNKTRKPFENDDPFAQVCVFVCVCVFGCACVCFIDGDSSDKTRKPSVNDECFSGIRDEL